MDAKQDEENQLINFLVKKKKKYLNLFLLLFSTLLSLVFIEIYLTKINYPYHACDVVNQSAEHYLGEFNGQTGWSYKRSISYFDADGKYEYHFNEDGIRVSSPKYKINYSKPIILFIGGSVAFGEELNYEETFSSQIGNLLENKFEIINMGVQGFGSAQSMLMLKDTIEKLDPKYVVYTFISDHINRNINYDRRLHVPCFEFSGTKPVFTLSNGKLKQINSPQKYSVIDRFKLPLFLNANFHVLREKKLLESEKAISISGEIISEISIVSSDNNAKDYYIYFDTAYDFSENNWNRYLISRVFEGKKDRVLNFTNWAEDSELPGLKYYVNSLDDIHPNASLSAEIAKKFVNKFREDFDE